MVFASWVSVGCKMGGFVRQPSRDRSALCCLPPLVTCCVATAPLPEPRALLPWLLWLQVLINFVLFECLLAELFRHGKPPVAVQGRQGSAPGACHFPDSTGFGAFGK